MEKLYQTYKDLAEIYIVYISEAHASDDSWPVPYARELGITEHKNFGERCAVAERLVKDKKLTIPCLIDTMDNTAEKAYQGWPDRVFLIRKDGRLAVAAKRGPWGFKPGLKAATDWLATYKKTGKEPPLPEGEDHETRKAEAAPDRAGAGSERAASAGEKAEAGEADYFDLERKLRRAYRGANYKRALELAERMHRVRPDEPDTLYNIACLHCLLGEKAKAYEWLDRAIVAGFADAEHMVNDADLRTIRGEDRFRRLVRRIRSKNTRPPPADEER